MTRRHVASMRTPNEAFADLFDCDLYRLIGRAERLAEAARPGNASKWRAIARKLGAARPLVREMMTEADRLATQG